MKKNIIITGASGNLGTATVEAFLHAGYKVIATGNTSVGMETNQRENLVYRSVNLLQESEADAFIKNVITDYGTVDGGLLLVGGFAMGGIDITGGEALKKMYALNFETAYYVARPLFKHMLDKGYGRLVFVGARPALKATLGKEMVAYALSKSLLFQLAELLNEESKGKNIVASVIVPSTIDTPQNRESMPDANIETWVSPRYVAEILEFICSDKSLALRYPVYKIYNNA
ncbi:MAG: SDR family NAD(P)-dependent oxidoreductase [Chitinophagaceae bacterium]